jgi:hypothetical protein
MLDAGCWILDAGYWIMMLITARAKHEAAGY